MEYRSLGTSGLKVPVLCLGAMTFGEADEKSFMHKVGCDEGTSFAIMSRALERGVNFIDAAAVRRAAAGVRRGTCFNLDHAIDAFHPPVARHRHRQIAAGDRPCRP